MEYSYEKYTDIRDKYLPYVYPEKNIEEDLLALHEFIMEHIDSRLHDDEFDKLYWLLDRVQNHISDDDFKILYKNSCELIQLREKSYDYSHDSNESNNCYFEIEELFKKFYNKFYISIIDSITKK